MGSISSVGSSFASAAPLTGEVPWPQPNDNLLKDFLNKIAINSIIPMWGFLWSFQIKSSIEAIGKSMYQNIEVDILVNDKPIKKFSTAENCSFQANHQTRILHQNPVTTTGIVVFVVSVDGINVIDGKAAGSTKWVML